MPRRTACRQRALPVGKLKFFRNITAMRTLTVSVLFLCVFAIAGCPVPQPQNTPVQQKLVSEPITRGDYWLYVPSTYNRDKPAPLIVTCHGTNPYDPADSQIKEWKMLAEQHGCIVIAPLLSSTDGIFGDGRISALLADERLIMSAIGELHYLYNIDRRNVLMTGFSGGGFPVYFVGLRHPDVFSAVVARNCNFNRHSVEDWYPPESLETPVMVYWGENDPGAIRTQSRSAVDFLRSAGFQVETTEIPGAGHERHPELAMRFWLQHWQGTPPPSYLMTASR